MLTGGQIADCTAGTALIEKLPACEILHAYKGDDSNAIREQAPAHGAMPNIPRRSIANGKPSSRRCSIATATRSSACFAG
jgi:hypothetical protein